MMVMVGLGEVAVLRGSDDFVEAGEGAGGEDVMVRDIRSGRERIGKAIAYALLSQRCILQHGQLCLCCESALDRRSIS